MPNLYSLANKVWKLLPETFKSAVRSQAPLNRVKENVRDITRSRAPHDAIYDAEYYDLVDEAAKQGSEIIADYIVKQFHPASAIDVGCGTGALLDSLRSRQLAVKGLEYSEAALAFCRARGLDVQKFDLEHDDLQSTETFDVAISTEVAEHLPASSADRYVDLLTRLSATIVFTAATPGQGGLDHVNEQPHEYWIEKFAQRGFTFAEPTSIQWREDWKRLELPFWYYQNLMIFNRSDSTAP